MKNQMEKEFFRPKEAAQFLCIGLSTLWLHIKNNKIKTLKPSPKTTIISREELLSFLNSHVL
ncbi:DNA-binding protein [Sulfurospirillum diekertiae]|uniref:DNA-binding protein n=1 Tax=Sulfurospirillum diekertiae TaxID=1854492 RepID=A0A290HT13_9BACT|nr:hypothetical protein [Sulfurospirillum diekertiae]ATB68519.1 hypothetical protein SJPD1_0391 [Sulfurospirillum diekertiae]QIR76369.1 DNA-binding protein [Sulfurospirillum diekertiae]QIR78994.1 DNA-binding protein [Sulfurospirillum diekertiae]